MIIMFMSKLKRKKIKKSLHQLIKSTWVAWPLKHTTVVVIVLVGFILLLDTAIMRTFFEFSASFGVIGAFFAGVLYVSLFTAAPSVVMLFELTKTVDIIPLILFASAGSVLGDLIILSIFRDNIYGEMKYLMRKFGVRVKVRKDRKKVVSWLLAAAGIFVLGTPLPDEAGIAMLGMTKYSKVRILTVAFIANGIGITVIVLAATLVV